MQNPQEISQGSFSLFQNEKTLNAYKQAAINLQATLKKASENRHHNDQVNIQQFMQLSPFFKELQQQFSLEFSKGIIKRGKIYCVNGNRCIYQKGDRMMRIVMPLVGKFYKKYQENDADQANPSIFEKLEELIQSANEAIPLRKKTTSMQRRMSILFENSQLKTTHANLKEINRLIPFSDEKPLFFEGLQQETYAESIYSSGQVWVFAITLDSFRACFIEEYQHRLVQKAALFRKMDCFNVLDDQQLKAFIERIPFLEFKRDDFVFRQGDQSQNLYLLVQGQAKALRTVQLFKQDPNSLYRGACRSQAGRKQQKPLEFSYADFEGVYNYSPQKKRMELGILAPVTIFGQQEIAAGLPRQADVQITSTKAKIFVFTLKDLEAAGNGKKVAVDLFMDQLYDSITSKRIMIRREGLSTKLQLENRRKMNYFFIQPTPEKHTRSRTVTQKINKSLSPAVKARPHSPVKPRYHNFNFNEFIHVSRKTGLLRLTTLESKIANLTHNSGEIQGKIAVSAKMSKQISTQKHKINIATPLFDNNYYKMQRKQMLRIENKKRMRLFQVTGISNRSKSRQVNSQS